MELERKWKQKDVVPFSVSSVRLNTKKDLLLNKVPWKHLCLSYAQGEEQVGWLARLAYALLVLIYTFGTHAIFTPGTLL